MMKTNIPQNQFRKLKKEYENIQPSEDLKKRVDLIMKNNRRANQSRRFFAGAAAGIAIFFTASVSALNISPTFAATVSGVPGLRNVVKVLTMGKYEVEDEGYIAIVETPQIEGLLDKDLQDMLNNEFKDNANKVIAAFEADYKKLKEDFPGQEVHMGINSGYNVKTDTEEILALDLYIVNVVGSSSTTHKLYTIDKKTGTLLTLPGLFKEGADYVGVISEYLIQEMESINEKGTSYFWIHETQAENFKRIKSDQNFYINTEGNLVICFDKYEVGPGSSGSPEFVVPNEVIKDILK